MVHIFWNFIYIISARWRAEAVRWDADEAGSGRADVPADHRAKLLVAIEQVPGRRQQDHTEGSEDAGDEAARPGRVQEQSEEGEDSGEQAASL